MSLTEKGTEKKKANPHEDMGEKKYRSLNERWEWVISFMVIQDMFVHQILLLMDKKEDPSVGTMGVCVEESRISLRYNNDFVMRLSDEALNFVITHEIYHLILHHCTKRLPEDKKQRKLWNIAADLAINSIIPQSAERKPPVDKNGKPIGCYPKSPEFNFEERLSMEQYIQLLRDKSQGEGEGEGDGEGEGGKGTCDGTGDQDIDNHDGWAESEIASQMVRDKVEEVSRKERAWGTLSADVQALILAAQKSQVVWTKVLRNYLGLMVSPERIPSFKKPNRRYPYPYCGKVPKYIDRKLVAIDTSGSVGDDALAQFLAEVNRLAETHPVDVCLFDWDITQMPKQFCKKVKSYDFKGRGGTCFEPVMKLAEERRYSSLIILTDGEAAAPTKPKYVKDILWVLSGKSDPPVEWGKRVRVIVK